MNAYIITISVFCIILFAAIIYESYKLYEWFTAEKVEAKVSKCIFGGEDGVWQYGYEVNVDGKTYNLKGPEYGTFNPILIFFPELKVGRTEIIRLNRKKMRIPQNPVTSVICLVLTLGMLIACSNLIIVFI